MNEFSQNQEGLSRKERREIKRQEARSEQTRAARGRGAKRLLTWVVVFAVLGGIGWFVWQAGQNAANQVPSGELAVPVSESDNRKGAESGPIELVEYGDYQCPACGAFHPVVEQLIELSDNQITFVFRHFPLNAIHPNADTAARAVEAAGLQSKYWEMHAIVFERQQEWSSIPRGSARDKMLEYAAEIGLNTSRLDEDMDSNAVRDKIAADIESGEAAGVNSTPSFYVNGKLISDFTSLQDFQNKVLGATLTDDAMESDTNDDSNTMEGEAL